MEYEFKLHDTNYHVTIEKKKESLQVGIDDRVHEVDCHPVSANCLSLIIDQKAHLVYIAEEGKRRYISLHGAGYVVEEAEEERLHGAGEPAGSSELRDGLIKTPMPGRIVKVLVSEDQEVEAGQNLVIIESMKMENNIQTPASGVVRKIFVAPGDSARFGESLVQIDLTPADS
jgi:biotin carboxyl carrier protein